ncbi:MAG: aminopeptidase [Pyrinomonadaceae bacterium]|jgi:aminopeptidase N|nr:aminopeptidase [Pyrinomonadaceae bacterium]
MTISLQMEMMVDRIELLQSRAALFRWVRLLTLTLSIIIVSLPSTLGARRERHIDSWKPINYDITLLFNDQLSEIASARVAITVQAINDVSLIDLDFGDLTVDSITVDGTATPFSRAPGLLKVELTKPLPRDARAIVLVSYHGTPKDGLVLGKDKAGKPSAIGDNWPDRVHQWIPCFDHPSAKAAVRFTVTAPARDLVVANGKLAQVENSSAATRTWTYTEAAPIPPYCMIIAVGEFAQINMQDVPVTPLSYYVPLPDKAYAVSGFAAANPSLTFFRETIAPYPYEKLALIVGATRFGGMENSGAIVFPNRLLDSNVAGPLSNVFKVRQGLVEVVAHEIAHQWFGDSVTESTWSDLWLSEGFATYFAGLMVQRYEGEARFNDYMQRAADTYFSFEKTTRIPIHDTETEDLFRLLNANNYQKGAWVLHMLRKELGDEKFFRGIRDYYDAHRGSLASTEDLCAALEKASGKNLKEFFARWVYGSGHPRYELTWNWAAKSKRLRLVLDQTQPEAAFPNAVTVRIVNGNNNRVLVIEPKSKHAVEEIKLDFAPTSLVVDPENAILDDSRVIRKQ